MKRKTQRLAIVLFVLGIVVTLFAATEEYDYGKVRWGMTIAEVVKATGGGYASYWESDEDLTLSVEIKHCIYHTEKYFFDVENGKLWGVSGSLEEDVTEEEAFLFLLRIYGKPIATNTTPDSEKIVFIRGKTRAALCFNDKLRIRLISYSKYNK